MKQEKFDRLIVKLIEEYEKQDNCMYDFLAGRGIPRGCTIEDGMLLYATLMNKWENDQFYRFNTDENWKENIVTGEKSELNHDVCF